MSTPVRTSLLRTPLRTVGSLAMAIVVTAALPSPAASRTKPIGACTLTPAADSMPFADSLLDAYRIRDGTAEILHDVHCTDGRSGSVWIAADVI